MIFNVKILSTFFLAALSSLIALPCSAKDYDVIIRNGTIYDGGGRKPFVADVAIQGDSIAAIGKLNRDHGTTEVDAKGMAVSPGFINMLSWATTSASAIFAS